MAANGPNNSPNNAHFVSSGKIFCHRIFALLWMVYIIGTALNKHYGFSADAMVPRTNGSEELRQQEQKHEKVSYYRIVFW